MDPVVRVETDCNHSPEEERPTHSCNISDVVFVAGILLLLDFVDDGFQCHWHFDDPKVVWDLSLGWDGHEDVGELGVTTRGFHTLQLAQAIMGCQYITSSSHTLRLCGQ